MRFLISALIFLIFVPFSYGQTTINDARLSGDKERTRLIFDLDKPLKFNAFPLADPYRLIIDLEETRFDLPPTTGQVGRGLVSSYRYGQFAPKKSRIVIDLNEPAKLDKSFILDSVDKQPARLVFDLVKTDRASFLKTLKEQAPAQRERIVSQPNETRPLIVIDPGHGGIDTGAVSTLGIAEKNLVFSFAQKLKEKLEADPRLRVMMTRNDDSFVPLSERVRIAREANASLFISVHADSLTTETDTRGATIYTLSENASDIDAARLAEKENKSDAIAGLDLKDETSEVSDILIDFTRRETKAFSLHFSKSLNDYMKTATRMHRIPQRSAGFRVLRAHDVPSVLVELGYITSAADLALLMSEQWRDRTSTQIAKAVIEFFVKTKGLK